MRYLASRILRNIIFSEEQFLVLLVVGLGVLHALGLLIILFFY